MGYVTRQLGSYYVDLKNPSKFYERKEGEKLFSLGQVQKRTGIGIILYSELDFNEFYKKHCERIPNDENEFTVLVDENDQIPNINIIRKLIVLALRGKIKRERNKILTQIPIVEGKKYYTKTFLGGKFLEENKTQGKLRFRDISDPKIKELGTEFNDIKKIWKSSFTLNFPDVVIYTWLIEHTDII